MKRHLFIVVLLASLLILASCNGNDVTKTGSLRLAAKFDGAKTIMPSSDEISCASYKVVGTFVNDVSNTLSKTFTGNTVQVDNMLVGPWLVFVEGYNENGILIAKSESQTITIVAGTTESSVFELDYLQNGTGYVDVCVHVPFGNTSIGSAVMTLSAAGNEDIVVALEASVSASDYSFICHEEIPVGNYSASFDFADTGSNQLGYPILESVHVFNGLTSSYEITLPEGFFPVEAPVITTTTGSDVIAQTDKIFMETLTEGASIHYTTDGSIPSSSSPVYTAPFSLNKNATVKAIAIKGGRTSSQIVSKAVSVKTAVPTVNEEPGSTPFDSTHAIVISASAGSVIYYTTDGTQPTVDGQVFTDWIDVDKNMTIKAIAVAPGCVASDIMEKTYKVKVSTPLFSIASGSYEVSTDLEISHNDDATIHYSLDNGVTWNVYTSKLFFTDTTIVKAYASKDGYEDSSIVSVEIVISEVAVSDLVFSIPAGTYVDGQLLTITADDGATIYYTTDGTAPSKSSNVYSGPITLTKSQTVKAYAVKQYYADSPIASAEYSIKAQDPVFGLAAGDYPVSKNVSITSATTGAIIYYTTDGSTPNVSSASISNGSSVSVSQPITLKAVAANEGLVCSDVVSAQYNILGNEGITVVDPVVYEVSIEVPELMTGVVVPGVCATLTADLSPENDDAVFTWYVDGQLAKSDDDVDLSSGSSLKFGTNNKANINLQAGFHIVTLKVNVDGKEYADSAFINVEVGGSGVAGENFAIGDTGPAGGIIFYDCDADNAAGNADGLVSSGCGWRFLEAAPEDVKVGDTSSFVFGYYRNGTLSNSNLYVNGSLSYVEGTSNPNDGKSTGTAIGTGKANTAKLVTVMRNAAYTASSGTSTTDQYAAKLADDYVYGEYDDWFLPSKDELNLIYTNLHISGLGGFADPVTYLSSSEFNSNDLLCANVWGLYFGGGLLSGTYRHHELGVRCIRAF